MARKLPQIDYMVYDSNSVCVMTQHLWRTVIKYIEFFFDIINTHKFEECG